jgi:hypothetical protein
VRPVAYGWRAGAALDGLLAKDTTCWATKVAACAGYRQSNIDRCHWHSTLSRDSLTAQQIAVSLRIQGRDCAVDGGVEGFDVVAVFGPVILPYSPVEAELQLVTKGCCDPRSAVLVE